MFAVVSFEREKKYHGDAVDRGQVDAIHVVSMPKCTAVSAFGCDGRGDWILKARQLIDHVAASRRRLPRPLPGAVGFGP